MGVTTYLYLLTSHRMILQVPFSTILPRRVPESYTAGSAPWHCHVPWCCWRSNWRVATGHSSHQQRRAASFRWLRNLRWIRGELWIWCCMHSRMAISIYFENTWNSNEPSFLGFDQIALAFLDSARTHPELLLKGSLASSNYETRQESVDLLSPTRICMEIKEGGFLRQAILTVGKS